MANKEFYERYLKRYNSLLTHQEYLEQQRKAYQREIDKKNRQLREHKEFN